jgi:hypothetical protein
MTTLKFITSNLLRSKQRIIRRISKAYGMIQDCTAFWQELRDT